VEIPGQNTNVETRHDGDNFDEGSGNQDGEAQPQEIAA
jgi:hypothetical protein